jgi:DNA repair photolyase
MGMSSGDSMRGRGALSNPQGRFDTAAREDFDDGWCREDGDAPPLRATVQPDTARTVIARNDSPDIPFDRSLNPYRGCEHGCVYCYARPSHAWLDLSPGLDFESRLFAKHEAPALLRHELAKPGYTCAPIALGANTDPYQPVERELCITRGVLEVLAECGHPTMIITKSSLVERDLNLLAPMARENLVTVTVSVTTLDRALARRMEPRAASPQRRIETLRKLAGAGIPAGILFAPVIPALNDHEMESVLSAAREAGATGAAYVFLRLPHELKDLFSEWLEMHYPDRAARVMALIRSARGGARNDSAFGRRMRGTGEYAELIARRFHLACRRLGLNRERPRLDTTRFSSPEANLRLF